MEPIKKQTDDDILLNIFNNLWANKFSISLFTIFSAFLAFSLTYLSPIQYQSYSLLKLNKDDTNSLSSSLGGLSMLGISSGSNSSLSEVVARLKSKEFLSDLVNDNQMQIELHAAKEWNKDSRMLVINKEIYNENTKTWSKEYFPGGSPTDLESYKQLLNNHLFVTADTKNQFITIGITHKSPDIAYKWVTWIVDEINKDFKDESISELIRLLELLEIEYQNAKISELKKTIINIINNNMNKLSIHRAREYFKLKPIDPAFIPEHKILPNRKSAFVASAIIALIISSLFYLVIGSYNMRLVFTRKFPFISITNSK